MAKPTIGFDPKFPYRLSEDQHTRLYQARHLVELLHNVAGPTYPEFSEIRTESLAVVCGLIGDLLDEAMPNMIFRKGA